jgi:hypothetical protein
MECLAFVRPWAQFPAESRRRKQQEGEGEGEGEEKVYLFKENSFSKITKF